MELRLFGKKERSSRVEISYRRPIDSPDVCEPRSMRGLELLVDVAGVVRMSGKEVSLEPSEIAIDVLLFDDELDPVNGGRVTLDDHASGVLAVHLLEHEDSIIHRVRQVRRRPPGFATADWPVVDNDNMLAGLREQIRR